MLECKNCKFFIDNKCTHEGYPCRYTDEYEAYIEGYNKALDDFVKLINEMPIYENEDGEKMPMPVEMIVEQLKKGTRR